MGAEDIEYMDNFKEFPTKESALDWLDNYLSLDERNNLIRVLQEPVLENTSKLSKELISFREGIKDENVLIGFNMAIAICNKYLGENK